LGDAGRLRGARVGTWVSCEAVEAVEAAEAVGR